MRCVRVLRRVRQRGDCGGAGRVALLAAESELVAVAPALRLVPDGAEQRLAVIDAIAGERLESIRLRNGEWLRGHRCYLPRFAAIPAYSTAQQTRQTGGAATAGRPEIRS